MRPGLRVQVIWDGAIVEDAVHRGRTVRVGAGARASAVIPGPADRYATLRLRGDAVEVEIEPGAVDALELDGEPPIDTRALPGPLRRRADPAPRGRLRAGDAVVEFERVVFDAERRDRTLLAWAGAAALVALFLGTSWRLGVALGDGARLWSARVDALNAHTATLLRVQIGPDSPTGKGSSRMSAGRGQDLAGASRTKPAPEKHPTETAAPKKRPPRKKAPATRPGEVPSTENLLARAAVAPPPAKIGGPAGSDFTMAREKKKAEALIGAAQSALLAADTRTAIDSFNQAADKVPLGYDQKNWLGLAFYLQADLDNAERVWKEARALDGGRPDAINNLASVAKRRGDIAAELQLLAQALQLAPDDCHALNSLALAQARRGDCALAEETLARSDAACGGGYAYTSIQRAAIRALGGDHDEALRSLEEGLRLVDHMVPIKEFEVWSDLNGDPAFASLRTEARFDALVRQYLPRAVAGQAPPAHADATDIEPQHTQQQVEN